MISYGLEGKKWQSGQITWSFEVANYAADAGRAVFSHSMSPVYQLLVQQAVQRWSSVSGLVFTQVADSNTVDIRIGFGTLDTALTDHIGLTSLTGNGPFLSPDVIVRIEDPAQEPIVNSNGVLTYRDYSSQFYQIVLHELGHALGLDHSPDPSAVMWSSSGPANRDLDLSDIAGIHAIYPDTLPDFDVSYYLSHYPDVAKAGVDPLGHYLTSGWREGRSPDALFDTRYYLYQNPDVAAAGINPLVHYALSGWHEGRDPSLAFSTNKYLQANPDVAAAGMDPLSAYLHSGQGMAFISTPHGTGQQDPLVDNAYYFSHYQDVAAVGLNPFTHYDLSGWHEGRNPDALFNTAYYLQQNPDVRAAAGIDSMIHYELSGWREGRNPSPQFSTAKYLAANRDVAAAGMNPLVHYELSGSHEGRAIFSV